MRVLSVVGARPNFMKVAPILRAMNARPDEFESVLVHTGQHYDALMSDSFFRDLGMPAPDFNLEVGSGTHAVQTAAILTRIEPVLQEVAPDWVLVVGDVNSTFAAALAAKKLNLRVAHVEAGLRSFDMAMPEEINRLCTDAISDLLLTTEPSANENLRREGAAPERVRFVGNVMIDSLLAAGPTVKAARVAQRMGLPGNGYALLTLHRPSNVDDPAKLREVLGAVLDASGNLPIVFPAHPRTAQKLSDALEPAGLARIRIIDPLPYIEFLSLMSTARIVLTDSGGLQEETLVLGVPCVTLRENTERVVTLVDGANRLAGASRAGIMTAIAEALALPQGGFPIPELWDGAAAERIVQALADASP